MHSGYVALVGRPNVGKSTLMNALIGEKISIVSSRAQTTRNRISGIYTEDRGQIVFVDTPGIHRGEGNLNRYMVETALASLKDVDVVAVLVEATREPGDQEHRIVEAVKASGRPAILVLNKVDVVKPADRLLPVLDAYSRLADFDEMIPVSALTGEGLDRLRELFYARLPEHPPFFPPDQLTEVTERFIAAETIREKIFELLRQEIPYSTAVEIESFDESDPAMLRIAAVVVVEREGQKGIIIGKGGGMMKEIGTRARHELEKFFATRVFLEIFVKVIPNWSKNPAELRRFGYE